MSSPTTALPGTTTGPASQQLAHLVALSAELTHALDELHASTAPTVGPPAAQALDRLIRGMGRPHDEQALGMPVQGARLIVALLPTATPAWVLDHETAESRVVVLRRSATEVIELIGDFPRRPGAPRSRPRAQRLADQLLRQVPGTSVGVSSALRRAADLPVALAEATDVAHLPGAAAAGASCADERWAQLAITRLAADVASRLALDNPLRRLADHDERRGSDLVETLRVWLAELADTRRTATVLGLHPNTLRYRLRRVQEVSGLDLSDPRERLLAQLTLMVGSGGAS